MIDRIADPRGIIGIGAKVIQIAINEDIPSGSEE
jgi:hypothetical protein